MALWGKMSQSGDATPRREPCAPQNTTAEQNKILDDRPIEQGRRSSSITSLGDRQVTDEEKAIPATEDSAKDQTEETTLEHDPNIVNWDENDPENPYNWTAKKKWLNIGILSTITFLTPLGSSFFAPGVPRLMADFNTTSEITATFVVSVSVVLFLPYCKTPKF